jgi:predicted nucleotidyltransferase
VLALPEIRLMVDPSLRTVLGRFEAAVLSDPSVLGVLYTGSLGRGTADRFSDLDLEVWLADEAFADLPSKTRALHDVLGTIELFEVRNPGFSQSNVRPDWRRVDLHVRRRDDTEPRHEFADARIVKDFDGTLARLVAASVPEDVTPTWEEARATIMGAIGEQTYIAANNARDATWEAMASVPPHVAQLYEVLARLRGRRSYGFRYAELLLSPAELRLMRAAWPATPTTDEVRRAARALWTWTSYVWAEIERGLGRALEITLDEVSLLAAVDALYEPEPPSRGSGALAD